MNPFRRVRVRRVRLSERDRAMLDPEEIRRRVRAIEIRARYLQRDQSLGEFRSAFRGRGLEFSQIRPYSAGDDVRFIDWKVTARRGEPFVKQFVEERERVVVVVVDVSGSQEFGTVGRSKRDFATELAGVLAYAAARSNDRVGAIAFSDRIEYTLPPRKGERQVLRMLRDLLTLAPAGRGTNLAAALNYAGRLARRGAVLIVISDFRDDGWDIALRQQGCRNAVVALVVRDPWEAALPTGGLLRLEDSESGRTLLVEAGRAGQALAVAADAERTSLCARLRAAAVDHALLPSDRDYLPAVRQLFRARTQRQ